MAVNNNGVQYGYWRISADREKAVLYTMGLQPDATFLNYVKQILQWSGQALGVPEA